MRLLIVRNVAAGVDNCGVGGSTRCRRRVPAGPFSVSLTLWDEQHYAPEGPRRLLTHAADDAPLDPTFMTSSAVQAQDWSMSRRMPIR